MNRKSRNWTIYVALFLAAASAVIIVEGFSRGRDTSCQTGQGSSVVITATDEKGFEPKTVTAKRCDTLVFQNKTKGFVEVALGEHNQHVSYPGFTEELLDSNKDLSLLLTERGTYLVHNHLNEKQQSRLTIE